jgi:general secretion pathway protein I
MRRRGFTLIEVLVALAIAAIGLGAALSVVTNATSNTVYLRDRVLASWIAENRIAEMRLGPNLPEVTRADGVVEFAARKWKWQSTVTQTQVDGLRKIDVEVRDAENEAGSPLASMSGFAGRTALVASQGISGDPFDPSAGGPPGGLPGGAPGGLPQVPATQPVPGQPSLKTQ